MKVERLAEGDRSATTTQNDNHHSDNSNGAIHTRFVPTEAWLQAVKAELPMNTITRYF